MCVIKCSKYAEEWDGREWRKLEVLFNNLKVYFEHEMTNAYPARYFDHIDYYVINIWMY